MPYTPEIYCENLSLERVSLNTKGGTCAELDRADYLANELDLDLEPPIFWFARIKAKVEHRGDGTLLMKKICAYMDQLGATIVNTINPYGDRSLEELISWFEQFGFEHICDSLVVRKPQNP